MWRWKNLPSPTNGSKWNRRARRERPIAMPAPFTRRLAGIRFVTQPPQLPERLPRMDIAAFVGFAAAGPLQRPVVVEDAAQFAAIFGDDLPLAWDAQKGAQTFACLAPAVRAFFRNGGRRCWVIRVAEEPETDFFPLPGSCASGRARSCTRLSPGTFARKLVRRLPRSDRPDGARDRGARAGDNWETIYALLAAARTIWTPAICCVSDFRGTNARRRFSSCSRLVRASRVRPI